jgi:hypothetical protein
MRRLTRTVNTFQSDEFAPHILMSFLKMTILAMPLSRKPERSVPDRACFKASLTYTYGR